jgi:hypothetical protein
VQALEERCAARGIGELRGDEHAPNAQGRAHELLDRPHSLRREEPLALARTPPTEVAS